MSERLRLFLAASVPEEQLRWLGDAVRELREDLWPEARWIPASAQHVTLKFLGATPEERTAEVAARCRAVAAAHRPAELRLGELGVFPRPGAARVLWVGLEDPDGLLPALAAALQDSLEAVGFPPESRPYTPHLTLARFRSPVRVGAFPPLGPRPPVFRVSSFALWRSLLSPRGARYVCLERFDLAP